MYEVRDSLLMEGEAATGRHKPPATSLPVPLNDNPVAVVLQPPPSPFNWRIRAIKRMMDVVLSLAAIIVLSPLLMMTALAILIESGLPVLFRQDRLGLADKPFKIFKFRSMSVIENGANITQARPGDPRVTAFGRVIRRTSLDEIAQLFNVLRGDMSLVGPRPHAVAHDVFYDKTIPIYAYRRCVKPGITGWAQVKGYRGNTENLDDMRQRVEHDLWYIDNWSLWLDIKILAMTGLAVFKHDAY
jgi:exopolysaccharide biosynthesis polyprenyl glycosylphosphotransferase